MGELSRTSIEGIRTLGRLAVHLDPALSSFSAMCVWQECHLWVAAQCRNAATRALSHGPLAACVSRARALIQYPMHQRMALMPCWDAHFHDMQLSSLRRAWNNFHRTEFKV